MRNSDYAKYCLDLMNGYLRNNADELYDALFENIRESESQDSAIWKIAVNAVNYSCQLCAMFVGMLLDQSQTNGSEPIQKIPPLSEFRS